MRVVFMGTPAFAVPTLEAVLRAGHDVAAVVTQPDRPAGRGGRLRPSPVKDVAIAHGLPVLQPERVRRPAAIAELAALAADCFVVVAFGQILPPAVLDLPRYGCINVHASLLPAYRGAAPIHWAVLNGETETGITTMWMDEGLDTGDMLLASRLPIGPDETTGELHDRLAAVGATLLADSLALIERGEAPRAPQNPDLATYAPLLLPEHERIDWSRPAQAVHNQIRGLSPWPGAYTASPVGRLKVWRSRLEAGGGGRETDPGTVVAVGPDGISIQCGDGAVCLTEVQPENKRPMTAGAFANGYRVEPGWRLG
jgi:methionyl-tRNA formyltransferase